MRSRLLCLIGGLAVATTQFVLAQGGSMSWPKIVEAGNTFSFQSNGSGRATLYIIGQGQVLKRGVQMGETTFIPAGSFSNAGHYLVILASAPTMSTIASGTLDVVPTTHPAELSFLAKPSRIPVDLKGGITGAVYVFDAYRNLILASTPVSFELSSPAGNLQKHVVITHDGAAWTGMDSTSAQGVDRFVARVGGVSRMRVVEQVPGDPCGLKMSARQLGQKLQLTTEPVRDCKGNAVPDGTIVTFTASYHDSQTTVDVPLKRGIAEVQMPLNGAATISVASGVVLGNQIGWGK
jgi:hypothetical protein